MQMIQGFKGGGKGGGGSQHVPSEADDTLKSTSYAKVLDVLSEGEIEGLAKEGLRGVYLDGTPIQNEDGSYNFSGVDFVLREGTQNQSYIKAFPEVESERAVDVEVTKNSPIVRTIDDLDVDAARVKIAVPRLTKQKTNGDLVGTKVSFAIDVQENAGSWVRVVTDTMKGKSSGRYEREYAFALDGVGPWQVRVVRLSEDDEKASVESKTYFASMTEVILAKLRYPNTALAGLIIDSAQFSQVPVRTYLIKGIKVRVPTNYNPETREYTGIWDGTFKVAWTCNPAWIVYDLLIEGRYGLGDYLDVDNVDKWGLYQIAQHCDELVDDGFGGQEPRYELHCVIEDARQAMLVINEVISNFQAMALWDGQQVFFTQDRSKEPVKRFTNANVQDGRFSYSGSSRTARHTACVVEWENPENGYQSEFEYVEDTEGLQRYGYNPIEIAAFGCTSQGQANRKGRSTLFTERLETQTVRFVTGYDAVGLIPGDVIETADSHRMGGENGGRVLSHSANSITVDRSVVLEEGVVYSLKVALPDRSYATRELNNSPGETSILTFSEALPAEGPVEYAIWVISSTVLQTSLWRVLSVPEKDGKFTVTALEYHPGKQGAVEQGLLLESYTTTRNSKPLKPENLALSEQLYESAGRVLNSIKLSCDTSLEAVEYQFGYSYEGETWVDLASAGQSEQVVRDIESGEYRIRARLKSPFGEWSPWSYLDQIVQGKTAPPADVQNLRGRVADGQFKLSWDVASDLDVLIGGQVLVRHAQSGTEWNSAADIGESVAGSATGVTVPLLDGSYLVKFKDSSGKTSNNSAIITTNNIAAAYGRNVVAQVMHGPVFGGVATGMTFIPGDDVLRLDGDGAGGYLLAASYELDGPDLGAVYLSRVSLALQMQIYKAGDLFDDREGLVDDWPDWDNTPDGSAVSFEFQMTSDDPANPAAQWSPWEKFLVGDYEFRGVRFRVLYSSTDAANVFEISSAKAVVDMPDVIEAKSGITCPAGGLSVLYDTNYYGGVGTPAITQGDPQTGDYFVLSNQSKIGFDIQFFNSSAVPVERKFNYFNKGF